ncbi:transmembrane protein 126A [Conger conger]|uniref:transmembrane protein 126A n=1 Tax=Conger conger TaxID=82655 RepID=UPI002A5A3645|nr:transmembrane protein 126A [Conger conger]
MSENTPPIKDTGGVLPKSVIVELLVSKYERLPEKDKRYFTSGPVFLGGTAAVVGLVANSVFRRTLNITQGLFTSSLPMAVLPFLTTVAFYQVTIINPLLSGDLNCATCTIIRGGLVGGLAGGLYPVMLALPVSGGLATRYNSSPMPEKGNVLRFWITLTQPVLRKMSVVVLLQSLFGICLSSMHYGIYTKMLELPASDSEELTE